MGETDERIFKCAVVGLGRIGWDCHIPAILATPGLKLQAVVDPMPERRQEAMTKWPDIQAYASLEELLNETTIEVVVLASPTLFHAEQAIQALDHGCHVFCDKPVALNHEQYQQMLKAAERNNRILEVYQPLRYYPFAMELRDIIASGKLGKLFQIKVLVPNYVRRNDWQAFKANGGGMLLNYGSHYVDLFLDLFDNHCDLLGCSVRRALSLGDAEDVVKIWLDCNSVEVDIDINQACALAPYQYLLCGEYGTAQYNGGDSPWHLRYYRPEEISSMATLQDSLAAGNRQYPRQEYPFVEEDYTCDRANALPVEQRYYMNFYKALIGQETLLNTPESTLRLTALIDKCAQEAHNFSQ